MSALGRQTFYEPRYLLAEARRMLKSEAKHQQRRIQYVRHTIRLTNLGQGRGDHVALVTHGVYVDDDEPVSLSESI